MLSKTIIIDCFGLFYRGYYAFSNNPLTNSKGQETAVVYSFFTSLHKIITERSHDRLVCILDSKGKTFRHELYEEYKAHRPPMPDSLSEQIAVIIDILGHLSIPVVNVVGLEADDIIAYYAQNFSGELEIVSFDKDLLQLITPQIKVTHIDKQQGYVVFGEDEVREKIGVSPTQVIDYLSLVGDTSDNVPGVRGIGNKTALKLIDEYGSLEDIYRVIGDIPSRYAGKLREGKKNAFLSRDLVDLQNHLTLISNDKLEKIPPLKELSYGHVDISQVKEIWQEYECFSLIKKYRLIDKKEKITIKGLLAGELKDSDSLHEEALRQNNLSRFIRHVLSPQDWENCIKAIRKQGSMVFDLETTSLIPFESRIVAAVVVLPDGASYYFSIIEGKTDRQQLWLNSFRDVLEDSQIAKIGHNLKFEYTILKHHGVVLDGIVHDTMLFEYLADPDRNAFKLSDLVKKYFQVEKQSYNEMAKGYSDITSIPPDTLRVYTHEDGEYTYLIYEEQLKHPLSKVEEKLYRELELSLLKVLGEMELTGVVLDTKHLANLEKILSSSLNNLKKDIHRLAGESFNINSTKELQRILFEKLRIDPVKKTKTGFSTDSFVLEKLSRLHPIAESLVQYRKTIKLLNTYVETLPQLVHPITGRLHTHYNQSVAVTGRLSSNNPNLQNIPVSDGTQGIRYAFIAPPGHDLVKTDYSQVELRIVAYLSQDPQLLKAYEEDYDIHSLTAHLIFGKPIEEILLEERNIAKTINFSVIYGISAFSLSEELKISREEAQFFIDNYFKSYAGVKGYQNQVLDTAQGQGWVETYYGRKRYVREINSNNYLYRSRAERIAFNTIIQGTASDIIKKAMVNIQTLLEKNKEYSTIKMVMQVHDELVFYVPEEITEKVTSILEKELTQIPPFDKILSVNTKVGKHWS